MADKANAAQKFKIKHFIKELSQHKGRGTELVSVYVPAGYEMSKITTHLAQEQGTATNIKSKQTRDNVINALEKMIQHLKLYPRTPPNGLAAFAGNVAEREGQQDYQVWSIEPPVPLNQRLYRCDKEFILDPLFSMTEDKESYGMVVMDRREGNIAILKGKTIIPLVSTESMVPGKFKAGGQSSVRFARNRELAAKDFYKKIADYMKEQFLEMKDLKGILVGGPGPTKYEFVDGNYITDQLKRKIITIKDLGYTGDFGLQELLERSEDVLANEEVITEKKAMQAFFTKLSTHPGAVEYGYDGVKKALEMGVVEKLLISETLDEEKVVELEKIAEQFSSEVVMISTETREGAQLKDLGKVAAILRYEIHS
ncbi:MAG: peptide chain release factor aRF-1 [Candidatus Woesearchaeota archaeon]